MNAQFSARWGLHYWTFERPGSRTDRTPSRVVSCPSAFLPPGQSGLSGTCPACPLFSADSRQTEGIANICARYACAKPETRKVTPKKNLPPACQGLRLLDVLEQSPAGRQYLTALCPALAELRALLGEVVRLEAAALVVRPLGNNIWEIGSEGDTRRGRFDGWGLGLAHATFAREPLTLSAAPNAAREALRRAATWADSRCPALAEAIRAVRVFAGDGGQAQPWLDATYRRALILE